MIFNVNFFKYFKMISHELPPFLLMTLLTLILIVHLKASQAPTCAPWFVIQQQKLMEINLIILK